MLAWYSQPTVTLSIAGIDVAVIVNSSRAAGALARFYQPFRPPNPGKPALVIEVEVNEKTRLEPASEKTITFKSGQLTLSSQGAIGWMDVASGFASLSLSSTDPLQEIDYFIRAAYALLAFKTGAVMIHAAGVLHAGRALLFLGHSGSGKTTIARFSGRDQVLNDDLMIALPGKERWMVFATPFWNPSQVKPRAGHAPLAALYLLEKDSEVYLERVSQATALAALLASIPVIPEDPERLPGLIEICQRLLGMVPVKSLHFRKDPGFWKVIDEQ
jgi:hypothetical protein